MLLRNFQFSLFIKLLLLSFSFLFSFALLINSVVTFAEATPLPPGIPQASEIPNKNPSGFETCYKTERMFRVGFYDQRRYTTTKSGPGVLVLCIGRNNCFGYTAMTTIGTSTAAVTVIHTVPRQRTDNPGILTTVYKQLEITADCDRFNRWSPPAPPLHAHGLWDNGPATTLVDILKNIVNLQSALRDYAPANPTLDVTVTIDSPVSYILAILDYLQLQGMLMKYDRPVVKELLDGMISTQKQDVPPVVTSSSLTLSWGFRFFTGTAAAKPQQGRDRSRWMTLTDPMLSVGKTFLCFGTLHCFGLGDGDGGMVKDIQPRTRQANLEQHFHFIMGNHAIYPSFDLQKFEESLKASVFLLKLTGHFRPPVRFADISSEEIQRETRLRKAHAEDHDTSVL